MSLPSRNGAARLSFAVLLALALFGVARFAQADEAPPPASFDDAVAAAKREGKPLVIEFFAVW